VGLKALSGKDVADKIEGQLPGAVIESDETSMVVEKAAIVGLMRILKESPEFGFDYLTNVTAVDNLDHFEVVYNLISIAKKHTLCVKARISGRENPEIPSITSLWKAADFQEREIFDLMGIRFAGHPNLKRIALWDGFEGYPLRKDFL
jgi:NADH-quinone oxidoreductase subunit C